VHRTGFEPVPSCLKGRRALHYSIDAWAQRDSNPHPPGLGRIALPLAYAPVGPGGFEPPLSCSSSMFLYRLG